MNSKSILVGTSLLFNNSVALLGPKGSGTYQVAWEALKYLGLDKNTITISVSSLNLEEYFEMWQVAVESRILTKLDRVLKDNPKSILCIHGVEKLKAHWSMYLLQQWAEGRKILMVGESCEFQPLFNRFEVVRM